MASEYPTESQQYPLIAWIVHPLSHSRNKQLKNEGLRDLSTYKAVGCLGGAAMRGIAVAAAHAHASPQGLGIVKAAKGERIDRGGGKYQYLEELLLAPTAIFDRNETVVDPAVVAAVRTSVRFAWEASATADIGHAASHLGMSDVEMLDATGTLVIPHSSDLDPEIRLYLPSQRIVLDT
jgi:hypothetical protein